MPAITAVDLVEGIGKELSIGVLNGNVDCV